MELKLKKTLSFQISLIIFVKFESLKNNIHEHYNVNKYHSFNGKPHSIETLFEGIRYGDRFYGSEEPIEVILAVFYA